MTEGKLWWLVREAGGHLSSAIRKQREMDVGTWFTFCFLLL